MSNDLFFLPSYIRLFTDLVTCTWPNRGSGSVVCLAAFLRIVLCLCDYFLAPSFLRLVPYLLRRWFLPSTPEVSSTPRTMWYFTPGRSFTRPPRTSTMLCSRRLWP